MLLLVGALVLAQISRRGHGQYIVLFYTTLHHCWGGRGRRDPLSHFWEGRQPFLVEQSVVGWGTHCPLFIVLDSAVSIFACE